jgi:superfamily II DNA or RNA helicase
MNYTKVIYNLIKDYEDISKCNFYELAKPFEYYSAIVLSEEYNRTVYHYDTLDMIYKEDNNLSKKDTGIDLCDMENIIAQVKLRSNSLTWKELSTFVAQINQYDANTKKRYIKWQEPILVRNSCATISPNLREQLNFNVCIDKPYELQDFYNFCNNLKDNPPNIQDSNDKFEERDYQIETINIINNNSNKNIYLCLPTGSGKTYIFIKSIELNKKYLILVPFIILLNQWYDEIVKIRPELKKHIQYIGDDNNIFDSNKLITISTYNSVELAGNLEDYYRVVIDEAHRIIKPEIYDEIDEDYEEFTKYTAIINKNITTTNNNLLLSATLDKPVNDNDLFHKVELRYLIDKGILSDYQVKIPIFEDDANDISVCEYIVKNYTNMIIYCSSQKEGKSIRDVLNKISKKSAYYIDCNTSKEQRKEIIKEFKKGNIKFLVNVRILIEGFDAKICNGVILYHISSNDKTIIQIIGRALRKHKNKLFASIVLPFINSEDSKDLQFILRVLASNDTVIKQRCITKTLGGYVDIETVISNPIVDNEDEDIEEDNDDIMQIKFELVFDSIGKCIKDFEEIWIYKLDKVKKFIDDNEKTPSSRSKNENEKKLGVWILRQKNIYKDLIFIMKKPDIRKKWEEFIHEHAEYLLTGKDLWLFHFKNLKKFIDDNGKTPNKRSTYANEKFLGKWIGQQKLQYKKQEFIMKNSDIRKKWETFLSEYL